MINELLLISGNDIPFIEAQLVIHQPSIKEIGYIVGGEEFFWSGCGTLNFSLENLSEEDRNNLGNRTDFEVLMSMLLDNSHPALRESRIKVLSVLSLIFPEYYIKLTYQSIIFSKEGEEDRRINAQNFNRFKEILSTMFCLKGKGSDNADYNPAGAYAKKIADKLKQRKQKLAEKNGEQKIAILSRYASILAVGQRKSLNDYMGYTVYQIFDEYERFELKEEYDLYIKEMLAGAKDVKTPEHWKKDIHPDIK
jgi:hypothetical protein